MGEQHFQRKRVAKVLNLATGSGTITIQIPFVPDFIRVELLGLKKTMDNDTAQWDLVTTAYGYDLIISYVTSEARTLKYVVAKLPVDPEATISF